MDEYRLYAIHWRDGNTNPLYSKTDRYATYILARNEVEAMGRTVLDWETIADMEAESMMCPTYTHIEEVKIEGESIFDFLKKNGKKYNLK